jgi:predicted site-specific integrase-resolvase
LGSGLNYKKKGLKQLLNLILTKQMKTLIVNHKDRLLIFGSELIFTLCNHFNIEVIVLEEKDLNFDETLTHDVIELITVFCAKLYGKRSHKNKLSIKSV